MPLLCPACQVDLVMAERQGVEIDYCPKCRGVWLDRGELDKIIEKAAPLAAEPQPQPLPPHAAPFARAARRSDDDDDDDDDDRRWRSAGASRGRRRNWLSDIFD